MTSVCSFCITGDDRVHPWWCPNHPNKRPETIALLAQVAEEKRQKVERKRAKCAAKTTNTDLQRPAQFDVLAFMGNPEGGSDK